ncbi:hypothetical protein Pint_27413 [Pistacia integerrima]|uniref:Uncharacterized protein n=1 Tax=Pistacia integerrima TaxID=434235 RepID=A0ACC0YRX2_9ROSI|nr:hypothetical protein Pint_27413 [Pistacia integerrima]
MVFKNKLFSSEKSSDFDGSDSPRSLGSNSPIQSILGNNWENCKNSLERNRCLKISSPRSISLCFSTSSQSAKLVIITNNRPHFRKSEIEYYAMLAKVGVHHYNGSKFLNLLIAFYSYANVKEGLDFFKEATSRIGYGEKIKTTIDVVFEEFDPVPIESASLAQVHVAHTHDGKKLLKFYSLLFLPKSSFSMLSKVQVSRQIMHKYRTRMFLNCFLCQNYFLNIQVQYTHMTDTAVANHATVELIVNTLYKFFPSFDYRLLIVACRSRTICALTSSLPSCNRRRRLYLEGFGFRWLLDEMRESLPKVNYLLVANTVAILVRMNCATNFGYWKTTGKDRPIHYNS